MGIKLRFDAAGNVEAPVYILATRNGRFIRQLPAYNIDFKDALNDASEISFRINKLSCTNAAGEFDRSFWDSIKSLKTMYCKEYDRWYEITVEVNESDKTVKNVIAKSLGRAELSQKYLYGYEINTEDDIARDDYEPSVLYNPEKPESSILDRILKKAPHYRIGHVDSSIANIQRTFKFDGAAIDAALEEVSEEIGCLVDYDCKAVDEFGGIDRIINVYDLECVCLDCGERGNFIDKCTNCGSTNYKTGYGEDTAVFVSKDNLADEVSYEVDTESVKNCFRLEAGDDLMTATIASCNPNGGGYIWYISDDMREDMSDELKLKLEEYDSLYSYYQTEYMFSPDADLLTSYNQIVNKYLPFDEDLKEITVDEPGFQGLMKALYNTIDLELFLRDKLMPTVELSGTTAEIEASKLNGAENEVAVSNIDKCTVTTATSAVEAWAKSLIRITYKIKATAQTYEAGVWNGTVTITNVAKEEDTASVSVTASMTSETEKQAKQKIDILLNKVSTDAMDVKSIFALDTSDFREEISKYCLNRLSSFRDSCQSVLDILIQQGAAYNNETSSDLYYSLYSPYREKLDILDDEIGRREAEILIVTGDGDTAGMRNIIEAERDYIQEALNFERYVGDDLWVEFSAYCREDTYKNENYISDGLDNDELFNRAQEFLTVARNEIFASATSQHVISAKLKNLLAMKEFKPIMNGFCVGNWIRVEIDGNVYRLRIIEFQFNYDSIGDLSVEFSDVRRGPNCMSDLQSILRQSVSMASSYNGTIRQAKQGADGANRITSWVDDGLALTNMKIVDDAENQSIVYDNHGLLGREYIPFLDEYDDKQIKMINSGLYMTDDDWKSCKVAIGRILLGDGQETYGINAENVIGKMIVGESMKILDSSGNDMFAITDGKIESAISDFNDRMTAITQTVDGISFQVSQIPNQIDHVETTTGYTFDKDGMLIAKSGEEIENRITNKGMFVNRRTGEDDDIVRENMLKVDASGVDAINITTRQYFIIGEHARFEPYDGNRTACFYI